MKKARIAIVLLLGILLVSGFACDGDGEPTPTSTPMPTPTTTPTLTPTPTPTPTPAPTPTLTPTPTPTLMPTQTPTVTPSPVPSPWSASNIAAEVGIHPNGRPYIYFVVEIPRTAGAEYYALQYRKKGESAWELIIADQSSAGNPIMKTTPVLGGETYEFQVRAHALLGTYSDWTSIVEKAAIADTTPPSAPTNLTATGYPWSIHLEWDNPSDADFSYTEVWCSDYNERAGASKIATTAADFFDHGWLEGNVTKYYWIRAVDASKNVSGWSNMASATTIDYP